MAVAIAATQVSSFIQQWEYALCHFQVDTIYIVGGAPPESAVLRTAVQIADASELPGGSVLVLLAPENGLNLQGTEGLDDFVHPANVVYWFGSDSTHIDAELFAARTPDHMVFIPTDTTDQMYSFASWAVVAWDRRQKG